MKAEINIELLMRQFFANKDARKKIKAQRIEYLTVNKCANKGKIKGVYGMADCITEKLSNEDCCATCKTRNIFFQTMKSLQYKNIGILKTVRHVVTK